MYQAGNVRFFLSEKSKNLFAHAISRFRPYHAIFWFLFLEFDFHKPLLHRGWLAKKCRFSTYFVLPCAYVGMPYFVISRFMWVRQFFAQYRDWLPVSWLIASVVKSIVNTVAVLPIFPAQH